MVNLVEGGGGPISAINAPLPPAAVTAAAQEKQYMEITSPPPPEPPPPPPPPSTVSTKPEPAVGSQPAEPGPVIGINAPPAPTPPASREPAPTPPEPSSSSDPPPFITIGLYDHTQLEQLWVDAGGLFSDSDVAAAIAQAESGGDRSAINNTADPSKPGYSPPARGNQPEYSVGLWQINIHAHTEYTEDQMKVPSLNAAVATALHDANHNFDPWSTFTSGAYRQYLTGRGPVTPAPPPSSSATAPPPAKAPPGVQTAWGDLYDFFNVTVPKRRETVSGLADSLVEVFR